MADKARESGAGRGTEEARTVLIVARDGEEITELQEDLRPEIESVSANTGVDALRISWSKSPPDLVLVDVDLDGMDGYEVCATLKDDHRTEHIPVILMASREQLADAERGLSLGAVDYVSKPFIIPLVKAKLFSVLTMLRQRELLDQVHQTDEATGLPNRDQFEEMLDREWRRGRREGTALSLILMAIDFSEAIHESCDPVERDICFRRVATVLNGCLRRASDFVARYSDEHFAAIIANTDSRSATAAAEMLREKVGEARIEVSYDNIIDRITMSFGTASIIPRGDSSPNVLKRAASKMLTEALDRGRNRVESIDFDPPSLPWFA